MDAFSSFFMQKKVYFIFLTFHPVYCPKYNDRFIAAWCKDKPVMK